MIRAAMALAVTGLLVAIWPAQSTAEEASPDVAAARQIVKRFAGELKGELKGAVEQEGFEHAIGVCKDAAPGIAAKLSAETGWRVGRTALRLRNPANAPDPAERAALQDFVKRAAAGEPLDKMESAFEAETAEGGKAFRYMKAIPTGELCTTCHGSDIDPELAARIRAAYPEDRATGFKVGELRGAFTLTKPLD
jgi:hypothetical protein